MRFRFLVLFFLMPLFLLANPPKQVKPDPRKIVKNKTIPKKVINEPKTKLKPKADAKPTPKPQPKPNLREDSSPLVKPSHPKPQPKETSPLVQPIQPKPIPKPTPKPQPQPKPQQQYQETRQPTPAPVPTPSSDGSSFLSGCQPRNATRFAISKSFGLAGDSVQKPLDGINFNLGYYFYFLSVMTEMQISNFSDPKLQAMRLLGALNIPVGCLTISPMGGVGVMAQDLPNAVFNGKSNSSYDFGLSLEYHLHSIFAVGMRYLLHNVNITDQTREMIHSFNLSIILYF
jgi:hypothetical protein